MPEISVIMSTYNEPEVYIRQAIDSILSQTVTDFEFIIVLDKPDNADMRRILTAYCEQDSRVRLIENEKNLGLVRSLNRALEQATGRYVARMDADDVSYPARLETEKRYLEENRLDMVGALVRRMDENGELLPGSETRAYTPAVIMKSLKYDSSLPHPTWFVKKEVYTALGGYRDMPKCEDYDFLLRAKKAGFRLGVCGEYLLNYRITSTGISQTGLLRQWVAARYLSKNYNRLEQLDGQEVRRNAFDAVSEKACENYKQASGLFTRALTFKRKNPIKTVCLLVRAMCTSRYFSHRTFNMLKLRIIRKTT